jgi:hypothetical protein
MHDKADFGQGTRWHWHVNRQPHNLFDCAPCVLDNPRISTNQRLISHQYVEVPSLSLQFTLSPKTSGSLPLILPDRIAQPMPPSTLISIDDSSVSGATHHLDTSSVLHARRVSTPILIDGPSGSRETRTSNVLHVHRVSSCDNCTSYIPCL